MARARKLAVWDRILRARADLAAARTNSETLVRMTRDLADAMTNHQAELRELRAELGLDERPEHLPVADGELATSVGRAPIPPAEGGSFSFMVAGAGRGGTSLLAAVLDANPQLEVHLSLRP